MRKRKYGYKEKIKNKDIDNTISAIKQCYGDKYCDDDFKQFKHNVKGQVNNFNGLIYYVELYFDLDYQDAHDMVMY